MLFSNMQEKMFFCIVSVIAKSYNEISPSIFGALQHSKKALIQDLKNSCLTQRELTLSLFKVACLKYPHRNVLTSKKVIPMIF